VPVPAAQHKNLPASVYHKGMTRCYSRNSELGSDIGDMTEDQDFLIPGVDLNSIDDFELEKVFSPPLERREVVPYPVST